MTVADEIDAAVVEREINLELRMRDEEVRDRRRQVKQPKRHRRRHFQRTLKFALQAARHLFSLDDIVKDAAGPLVIGLPGLGQAQAARRAMEEARSQSGFERPDPSADNRLGKPEPLRGAGETGGFDDAHEDGHILEKAHRVPISRTIN